MLRSYEEDVEEAMKQCLLLLEEPDLETGVRSGDIYGFMIEHYASTADYQKVGCDLLFRTLNSRAGDVVFCQAIRWSLNPS